MKRLWDKPELIVLMRRKSDEVILVVCKGGSGGPDKGSGWFGPCIDLVLGNPCNEPS